MSYFKIYDAAGHYAVKRRIAQRKRTLADKIEQEANLLLAKNPEHEIHRRYEGSKEGSIKFTKDKEYIENEDYHKLMDRVDELRQEADELEKPS